MNDGNALADIVHQQAREIRALRHRNEALEQALYGAERESIRFPARRLDCILAALLMRQSVVSIAQGLAALEAAVPSPDGRSNNAVEGIMGRLRRLFRPLGVEIYSERYKGYWLTSEGKTKLREVYGVRPVEAVPAAQQPRDVTHRARMPGPAPAIGMPERAAWTRKVNATSSEAHPC